MEYSYARKRLMLTAMNLVDDDFIFQTAPDGVAKGKAILLHCRNAPSPAATSSIAIGDAICDEASKAFGLS